MLPRAGTERSQREAARARSAGGPTRSSGSSAARCAASSTWPASASAPSPLDCDVLQADGGTRTASITGAYVALARALHSRHGRSCSPARWPRSASASSSGEPLLDLDYAEDSTAEVDFNVVMTDDGRLIEVQGTAEHGAFTRQQMDQMVDLAAAGIRQLFELQRRRSRPRPGSDEAPGRHGQSRQAGRVPPAARATCRPRWSPRTTSASSSTSTSRTRPTRKTPRPRPMPLRARPGGSRGRRLGHRGGRRSTGVPASAALDGAEAETPIACSRLSATPSTGARAWSARWRWPPGHARS